MAALEAARRECGDGKWGPDDGATATAWVAYQRQPQKHAIFFNSIHIPLEFLFHFDENKSPILDAVPDASRMSDNAFIFPITPSTLLSELLAGHSIS